MANLTLCAVPSSSSIVTAIVRYRDSKCSLDLTALGYKLFGRDGKVIRMTQLLPDSWMLLGYQYNDGAPGPCTYGSLNAGWISSSYSDAANDETVHLDYDSEEVGENKEEGLEKYNQRTHRPWLQSDEARLLSLKDNQGMEWKEICKRFPDRSPGAVKLRYYTLHKKGLSGYRDHL
ncbi:hypothetical protein BU26DRAFT_508468 [Trematosphaeria pertusa]|uniref:Myb-like domain-containing protein n=1 Tax=Trematosphaeria pertusa TaxID=390896 RepID=A0A6A6I3Q4_9PLEO|nr:uncharacterized protein BU26DRAFT_508468 [Trematosphaeria pertusa]KAF2245134.1 hypothetical protein BU26DRAFT_508468 [Trematosphaeria pertusa]